MTTESPIIPGIDNSKRYKAAVRLLDGSDVRVYSTARHPTSHYGYIVHAIEEISEDEAAKFEEYCR